MTNSATKTHTIKDPTPQAHTGDSLQPLHGLVGEVSSAYDGCSIATAIGEDLPLFGCLSISKKSNHRRRQAIHARRRHLAS